MPQEEADAVAMVLGASTETLRYERLNYQTKKDNNLLYMTLTRTHIRKAAPSWCIWTTLEIISSISPVARRAATSAERMFLLIQREWPVGHCSHKELTRHFLMKRTLHTWSRARLNGRTFLFRDLALTWADCGVSYNVPCKDVRKLRLEPIERLWDTLIAKSWRTVDCFKASTAVFWLSKGPTGGHYSQIHERSAAAGLATASTWNVP